MSRGFSSVLLTTILLLFSTVFLRVAVADNCVKPEWKVTTVSVASDPKRAPDSYVELGDIISLKSPNLADLRQCAVKSNKPVVLYIDRMPLKGLREFPPSDPAGQEARYTLQITPDNRPVWNKLLGSPDIGSTRPFEASIGLADGFSIASDAKIKLRPVPPFWFGVWALIFIAGLIAFFWLALKTNLLRGGTPAGVNIFSMARSQGAWWFFLILAAYLLIGLTTGDYTNSVNSTALILLGIASGTYLASAAVDASKDTAAERAAQQAEKARLEALAAPRTPEEEAKLRKLQGQSEGWLRDVLSTSEGIDFHRFQMLVWTFVLGVIFIIQVWRELAMPEFSATLLGLMGLSAGTYVGLKIPEKTK